MTIKTESTVRTRNGTNWLLLILPILLLIAVLAYIILTGGGLQELAGPPVEHLSVTRIALPQAGVIEVEVVNDGPQELTIAQVAVDDAYWSFDVTPSATIPRFGSALFTIPYPWVRDEAHIVKLLSSIGTPFEGDIAVAVTAPQPSWSLFLRFGLVGLYVGIVPIALGMLWFPLLRRLGRVGMNFVLSLTIGLLIYLAVGTWLDALEFATVLPVFWQGVPLVLLITVLTLGILLALGNRGNGQRTPLQIAYLFALGIGLHNMGEGLAIGAAFRLGEAALGTFLVVGFTLHNITEGVGIVSPLVREPPRLLHFVLLALLAGGPAIIGTWVGGLIFNPVAATVFLAIGVGAILQVIWEIGKLLTRDAARNNEPLINWFTLGGVSAGVAIMYFTAFFVKF